MKHTEGQWIFNAECKNITDSEGITIASLGNKNKIGFSNYEANAKLIAAAPDMLEALNEAKRMYEELEPAGGWQGVYEQIEDAIKKQQNNATIQPIWRDRMPGDDN
ncbi:MAG: hypothetical protein JJE45_00250 [Prolixibacteraceae bacterium]|nr:hypothetical protein [Prolixibacteraceae bacterium]